MNIKYILTNSELFRPSGFTRFSQNSSRYLTGSPKRFRFSLRLNLNHSETFSGVLYPCSYHSTTQQIFHP